MKIYICIKVLHSRLTMLQAVCRGFVLKMYRQRLDVSTGFCHLHYVRPHKHKPANAMHKPLFVILAIAAGAACAAGTYTPEQIRAAIRQAGSPERFLAAIATNTAKMSGQMFDDQTQITGAAANQKTLVYYMRLVNYEKADIPDLSASRRKVASTLSPSVCTAPVASILINEHGAEYKYMAYSKSREYLFEYSFNRTTCAPGYRW